MSPRWEKKDVIDETPAEFSGAFDEVDKDEKLTRALDTVIDAAVKRRPKEPKKDWSFPKKWGLIKIEQKRTEHDIDDIPICVNGKNVLVKRDEWTPLNFAFVNALREAKHPIYGHKPGQLRQVVGMNTRFPFQVHEITEQEFNELRKIALKTGLTIKDIPERYRSVIDMS